MPRNRKKGRSRRVSSKPDTTPSQTKLTAKDEEEAKQTEAERAQAIMAEVARRKAALAASKATQDRKPTPASPLPVAASAPEPSQEEREAQALAKLKASRLPANAKQWHSKHIEKQLRQVHLKRALTHWRQKTKAQQKWRATLTTAQHFHAQHCLKHAVFTWRHATQQARLAKKLAIASKRHDRHRLSTAWSAWQQFTKEHKEQAKMLTKADQHYQQYSAKQALRHWHSKAEQGARRKIATASLSTLYHHRVLKGALTHWRSKTVKPAISEEERARQQESLRNLFGAWRRTAAASKARKLKLEKAGEMKREDVAHRAPSSPTVSVLSHPSVAPAGTRVAPTVVIARHFADWVTTKQEEVYGALEAARREYSGSATVASRDLLSGLLNTGTRKGEVDAAAITVRGDKSQSLAECLRLLETDDWVAAGRATSASFNVILVAQLLIKWRDSVQTQICQESELGRTDTLDTNPRLSFALDYLTKNQLSVLTKGWHMQFSKFYTEAHAIFTIAQPHITANLEAAAKERATAAASPRR
jgi:hypothetical protein